MYNIQIYLHKKWFYTKIFILVDYDSMSNNTSKNKSIDIKPYVKNDGHVNKNEIS